MIEPRSQLILLAAQARRAGTRQPAQQQIGHERNRGGARRALFVGRWRAVELEGIGFAGNPRLGLSQPQVAEASAVASSGRSSITIVMNYLRGMRMRPLASD